MSRSLSGVLTSIVVILALTVFLRSIWSSDPDGAIFWQAGQMELSGQPQRALERYELIANRHPNSSYAPRALQRAGDLLAAQGRQGSNKDELRQSIDAYVRLATKYPNDVYALTALQDAGTIAAQDLDNRPLARNIYRQIIQKNGQNTEIGAGAIVKIARLSIEDKDGPTSQLLLQEILRKWSNNAKVGGEAQYLLGMCYEKVFHKMDWATRAYDAVMAKYPKSQWATEAKTRLGLLAFAATQGLRPTRRVMLAIQPLPDETSNDTSKTDELWGALRVALAARGLSGDTALLRGYSLTPFYGGLNPNNPGQVIGLKADAWQNVAGAAGFRYSIKGGGREDEALRDLQDDLDAARLPLVFWQDEGKPTWSLAIGYDSERGEVMLQNQGAQFDTLAAKSWAPKWKVQSSLGKPYTIITLIAPGSTANPSLTPTPVPTAKVGQTPKPLVNGAPAFVWGIAPLKEEFPIGRTAQRASILLLRNGSNTQLVNAGALTFLANALGDAAREARRTSLAPVAEATATATSTPEAVPTEEANIYDPTPTAAVAAPIEEPREALIRAQKLWAFWSAPATSWVTKRREAAQWCRLAALKTNNARFNRAADAFDQSADDLEGAAKVALTLDATQLGENAATLDNLARACRQARQAERQAAQELG